MIKHSGLGQLADVAKEHLDPAGGHYPVRRRGERRELRPNWTGIEWLEAQTLRHTYLRGAHPVYDGDEVLWYTRPAIRLADRVSEGAPTHCARPMIELIDDYLADESRLSTPQYSASPCPHCDDWSRTARCPQHTDLGATTVIDGLVRRYGEQLAPEPDPAPQFTTDAVGVLIAQQGDTLNALRDAIRDEVRRQFQTIFFDNPA